MPGEHGPLRLTRHRQLVLDVVRQSRDHPTVAEVYERARRRQPRISHATVYTALSALARHGYVLELSSGGEARHYDGRTDSHDHAVCVRCGRLMDVEAHIEDAEVQRVARETGYRLWAHHTEYYGLCPSCVQAE